MLQYTKFSKCIQAALLVLMLLASLLTGNVSNARAQSSAPELFADAGNLNGLDAAPDPVFVSRSRFVSVNTSALLDSKGDALDAASLPEVILNLFPDTTFTGVITSVKKDNTTITWTGALKDIERSSFSMVIAEGVFIAHVDSTRGTYEVTTSKTSGMSKVIQIDPFKLVVGAIGTLAAPAANLSTADTGTNTNSSDITVSPDFSSSFTSNATGWTKVYGGDWHLKDSIYYTEGSPGYYASIKHTYLYEDFTYTVRMKRKSSEVRLANYLLIRGNPEILDGTKRWKPSYMFGYTNNGYFSVLKVRRDGLRIWMKEWTTSTAIVKNGWNTLRVIAVGSSLRFYINGKLVYNGIDTSYSTGQVGINMFREVGTTYNVLYVDSATLTNLATADLSSNAVVMPGKTVSGGNFNKSP